MKNLCLTLCFACLCVELLSAETPAPPEIREREIYVPYSEFLKVSGKDPQAMVMTLDEYRNLVALAATREAEKKNVVLPPVKCALAQAIYDGKLSETTVRFEATFKLFVASDEWVRCELGPALPGLGKLTLDGGPAWAVAENGRVYLLVNGRGPHSGTFSFTRPIERLDDAERISGALPKAATALLKLEVAGRATAQNENYPVETAFDEAANLTRFSIALGGQEALEFQWKRKHDAEKNPPLLMARQRISYLPERASPLFRWQAQVTIARRKTDELIFTEPPGARVTKLSGPNVHSWQRDGGAIRILLDKPLLGETEFEAEGIVPTPPGAFTLGFPELRGALRDMRFMALFQPDHTRLNIDNAQNLRELAPGEVNALQMGGGTLAHAFLLDKSGAQATVRVTEAPPVYDTQIVAGIYVEERQIAMRAVIDVQPEQGRLYNLQLVVGSPWALTRVEEHGTGRAIRAEMSRNGDTETWDIALTDAADLNHPLRLRLSGVLRQDLQQAYADPAWNLRSITAAPPVVSGGRRSKTYLGISVQPTIDVAFGANPAWQAETPEKLRALGVPTQQLRAGLVSENSASEIKMDLQRRAARGEYDAVTHVLTYERDLWLRCDVRLAVVDRAIDELVLTLPANAPPASGSLAVTGNGVKEVVPGTAATQRVVRFSSAWRGIRMLRVEYRAPLAAETQVPVPDVRIEGGFDSARRIIFQSAGSAELSVQAGPALSETPLEDTPEFAVPFRNGRSLYAFMIRNEGAAGTFSTRIFPRSPVLKGVVKEMNLKTVLDSSGVSRTHASFGLTYAREQYLPMRLPADARVLALTVVKRAADGQYVSENVQPVDGPGAGVISVPLPPLSVTTIELVYERRVGELGLSGTWREAGPDLMDVPTSASTWRLYYPQNLEFTLDGGNLRAEDDAKQAFFASTFWRNLFMRGRPRWTVWEQRRSGVVELSADSKNQSVAQETAPQAQALIAIENKTKVQNSPERSIGALAIPEGVELKTAKLGGAPEIIAGYREVSWSRFAGRAAFFAAAFAALWLARRRSLRAAGLYICAGLFLATVVPPAFDLRSSVVAQGFGEGLTLAALCALLLIAWNSLRAVFAKLRPPRAAVAVSALVIFGILAAAFSAAAGEIEPAIIPFQPYEVQNPDAKPGDRKVYVPKSRFSDLMKKAFPEKEKKIDEILKQVGVPIAIGPAQYEATLVRESNPKVAVPEVETAYVIKGGFDVRTFSEKGWAKLPLNFGTSQLVSATVDGSPANVAQENGIPFIQIQGMGQHRVEVQLQGKLLVQVGSVTLRTRLVGGLATRLTVKLPENAEVDFKTLPAGAWIVRAGTPALPTVEIDLGSNPDVALRWQTAEIRAKAASQISAVSYAQLQLEPDGYSATILEAVTINGSPLDMLAFSVVGAWEVGSVTAADLSEWTVTGEGASRRLQLWFQKPVQNTQIFINSWVALDNSTDAQVAALSLEGALRQEGFIGLKYGGGRRFKTNSLAGLKRSSSQELLNTIRVAENSLPDRIYHFHEIPTGHTVGAELDPAQVSIDTHIVGIVKIDRLLVSVRSRYNASGRAPLRHEVDLPAGWTVRAVRCNALRTWEILDIAGGKRLVIHFTDRATAGTELIWSAEQTISVPATGSLPLSLPIPRALGDEKQQETVDWVLAADKSLSLSQGAGTTMPPLPLPRAPMWAKLEPTQEYALAFHSNKPDVKLSIDVSRRGSIATASVVSFIRGAEDHVQVNTRCRFRIAQAGLDRFIFKLPAGATLVSLNARNFKSRELAAQADGTLLTVLLQAPAIGDEFVDLIYRLPRKSGADVTVSGITIQNTAVSRVENYVGLMQADRGIVNIAGVTSMTTLKDIEELPFIPADVSKASLSDVFSAAADWSLLLRQPDTRIETGAEAEIRLALLKTVIASDGRMRSVATYTINNRSRQFFGVVLPPDSRLWGVLIGGKPSTVSLSKKGTRDQLLVPLQRMSELDLAVEVTVVYENPPVDLPALVRTVTPVAPELDIPVVETYWQLFVPDEYQIIRNDGNMHEIANNVLLGGKVKSKAVEVERLIKFVENVENPGAKLRALRNLSIARQQLDDSSVELDNNWNASAAEAKRFKDSELSEQMRGNITQRDNAQRVQQKLQTYGKQIEDAVAAGADADRQRAFQDNYKFLGNEWRGGGKYVEKNPLPATEFPGEVPVRELWDIRPFPMQRGALPAPAAVAPVQDLAMIPENAGLREDADSLSNFDISASDLQIPESRNLYTFFRLDEKPELTVTLRSEAASWRLGAQIALGLFVLILAYAARKRKIFTK